MRLVLGDVDEENTRDYTHRARERAAEDAGGAAGEEGESSRGSRPCSLREVMNLCHTLCQVTTHVVYIFKITKLRSHLTRPVATSTLPINRLVFFSLFQFNL